jgi:hypothetical protein
MLDSGAFTFMKGKHDNIDWDDYTERYAQFINDNDIKLFFELDIDSVVGIKRVEHLRKKLERLTGKRCIPVWHKSRGRDYWIKMIKEYDYVAIGGIVSGEIKKQEYPFFNWLLAEAKKENCKVHGLGFTAFKELHKYKFYSVDSTAWLIGNISGFVWLFNGKTVIQKYVEDGYKLKNKEVAIHNFQEWIKFQNYAKRHL